MRLLIIITLIVISTNGFGQNNGPCGKIYQVTDTIPKLISSGQQIADILARKISISDSLLTKKGRVDVQYVINCNGHNVKFKVLIIHDYDRKPIKNDFNILGDQIIPILQKDIKWAPARQGGKHVDFLQILTVEFREGFIGVNLEGNSFLSRLVMNGN
ncbi:MAG: hypothetical protein JNM78_18610 [Cyclobacteriaceae bacterium]|nr:hypothetical protein [Cyclobacteriaceae bacterium]